jgi:hypothetical protein
MAKKNKSASTPSSSGSSVSKVSKMFQQARESLKLLETLEKETLAKAKLFVRKPLRFDRRKQTNDRILSSLKGIGVATRAEVEALELKVEQLSQELASIHQIIADATFAATSAKRSQNRKAATASPTSTDAFPNT